MIANTRKLFVELLPRMRIGTVCDIGSMNGADALMFRDAVPQANIYAFEPNPANFRLMEQDRILKERNIRLLPLAVTNSDGAADFFLVEADYSQCDVSRGLSSLYRRSDPASSLAAKVRVATTRLGTFFADKCSPHERLALWIDTEGTAYEVIEGTAGLAKQVYLLHVEVETSPCIALNQKLYPEVNALLQGLGFAEVATDYAPSQIQFNALFVRRSLSPWTRCQVKAVLIRTRLRYLLLEVARKFCPACLRRYEVMRVRALSRRSRKRSRV
jgi:FkbM family methyltransferase